MSTPRTIAVIGAGYWGPNLVRNFRSNPEWDLVAVCDLDDARAQRVVGSRSTVEVETSVAQLLRRRDLDAVAIATPARTHAPGAARTGSHASRNALRRVLLKSHRPSAVRCSLMN